MNELTSNEIEVVNGGLSFYCLPESIAGGECVYPEPLPLPFPVVPWI